jgi:outer membrane receptor for Fe3+-dicitrate
MLYARVAKGFVPGGPNDVVPTASGVAPTYTSSTTVNYEMGIKSQLLQKRLTVELDVFDIEWRDIQLQALINGFGVVANGGTARSRGTEWSVGYMPLDGLTLGANGAYTDAYLTQATPASVNGHVGDRLPAAPLWGTSASADYERVLYGDYSGFAGVNWRFTGTRYADFSAAGPRQMLPSYNIVDARAGVETHRWSVALYVKNIGNRLAINYIQPETGAGGAGPQSAWVYTPRTLGVTVTGKWE